MPGAAERLQPDDTLVVVGIRRADCSITLGRWEPGMPPSEHRSAVRKLLEWWGEFCDTIINIRREQAIELDGLLHELERTTAACHVARDVKEDGTARDCKGHQWRGLNKLIEECGELIAVLGKLHAYPNGGHPDEHRNEPLLQRVMKELADVEAAIEFFQEANPGLKLPERVVFKLNRFRGWDAESGMSGVRGG